MCLRLSLPSLLRAQTKHTLPGCDPSPKVRKVLDTKLLYKVVDKMKFVERTAYERRMFEGLIAKYPREIIPYQRLIQETRYSDPEAFPALQVASRNSPQTNRTIPSLSLLVAWLWSGKILRRVFAIQQNWIVDPKGTWRWTQIGYRAGTDADFSKDMLERLESMKSRGVNTSQTFRNGHDGEF